MDWSRYAGAALLVLGGAVLVAQGLRTEAWSTRLRRMPLPLSAVLVGYFLAVGPWHHERWRSRTESQGAVVVRAIEDHQARFGTFPETLTAIGVEVPEMRYPLSYGTGTSDGERWFWFSIGDYFKDGFTVSWDSRRPDQGWYWDT